MKENCSPLLDQHLVLIGPSSIVVILTLRFLDLPLWCDRLEIFFFYFLLTKAHWPRLTSQWKNISVFKTLKMSKLLENWIALDPGLAFVNITLRQSTLIMRLWIHCIFSILLPLFDIHSLGLSIVRTLWGCFQAGLNLSLQKLVWTVVVVVCKSMEIDS